ncbi:MAG: hypothetical protein TEF_20030 [Rhizobiales bacterium NRL2]|jgi:O-antigen ligase|nr:MAG: hypothetical protein TEF_20030 [Rhizobiales bacterium NRL2]
MLFYFERFLVLALIVVLAAAPLPLGSNRPVSWSLLSFASGGLVCLWGLAATFRPTLFRLSGTAAIVPAVGWLLLVGWLLAQTGGPEFLWHPLWTPTAAALGLETIGGAIAVSPSDAATSAMRLLAYGGIFWVAAQTGREPDNAAIYVFSAVGIGTLYALYGLAAEIAGGETIVGLKKWAYEDSLTSTFVNRNSFATFAALAAVAGLGMVMRGLRAGGGGMSAEPRPVIHRPARISPEVWLCAFAVLILVIALVMTRSRAGLVAGGVGMAALGWAWFYRRGRLPGAPVLLAAAAASVVVVILAAGGGTFERKVDADGQELSGRPWLFQRTISAIADEPLTGHGGGAFESYFHGYKNAQFGGVYAISKAHNSYLEFAADAGAPALLLLLGIYAWIAGACIRGVRVRRQDAIYPAIGLAAAALVGLHALVDFSVQIPAVAALFAMLLGVGYAQAFPTGGGRHNRL